MKGERLLTTAEGRKGSLSFAFQNVYDYIMGLMTSNGTLRSASKDCQDYFLVDQRLYSGRKPFDCSRLQFDKRIERR